MKRGVAEPIRKAATGASGRKRISGSNFSSSARASVIAAAVLVDMGRLFEIEADKEGPSPACAGEGP